jgi:Leucine-rich repeat (LRR) protein
MSPNGFCAGRAHVTVAGRTQPIGNLSQLTDDIHITGIDLTSSVMRPRELVKLEGLTDLRELYLPGPIWNPGGGREDSTAAFKTLATLTSVERLAFGWHFNARIEIRDKQIQQLAGWTKLKDLRCGQCALANADLSQFPELENLDLSDNPFTNKGMEGLAGLKKLRRLLLRNALVTDDGLKWIAGLSNLEELDLGGVRLTDKGIEYLRNLKAMRRLNLLGVQATDASMDVIAGMPHLEVLNLYRTKVTNTGLAKLKNLKGLADLDLRYTRVTSNGMESLRAALPNAKVQFAGAATPPSRVHAAERPSSASEDAIADVAQVLGRHDSNRRTDT